MSQERDLSNVADLLLEIFSEEIPARMQLDAATHLQSVLEKALQAKAKSFVTPRRLAIIIENLPEKQPDIAQELKGPKVGAPEAALQGFLKKSGLTLEQLEQRDGVYFANIQQKGRATSEVLKETIEKILSSFPWPKSMRWGTGETAWVRPLHSIVCLLGDKIVPVEFAGINAGNSTRGHRFLAPQHIIVTDAKQYESALEKAFVAADRDKRKADIAKQLDAKCKALGVSLHVDAGLLEEVTGLVEWPTVLSGKIDASYMDLPEEVLILEMKNHQKYFATRDAAGKLSPHFLITSNMVTTDAGKAIIAGNERVLRARFADGRFFYDQDRKTKLEDWAKKLADVTYHAELGSVADKAARVKILAAALAAILNADTSDVVRAADLAKADLVTGMVGEFPELQGVMGRYYANHQGEKPEVADAIRDHYKPQGPSDSVPAAPVSVCVALAEKLDTLISMFAIGEKPTGSKDPFALRRAALGVIRIVLENNLRLPLKTLLQNAPLRSIALRKAHEKLVHQAEEKLADADLSDLKVGKYLTLNEVACEDIPEGAAEKISDELLSFFHDRLKVQMKEEGLRHDVIAAIVADGDDDIFRVVARAKALQEFFGGEDGTNLLAGYKRAANILAIEEKKDSTRYTSSIDSDLLREPEELALASALAAAKHRNDGDLLALSKLRAPVDAFFDKILVNAKDDAKLRVNRLGLLADIRDTVNRVADFSKIEG